VTGYTKKDSAVFTNDDYWRKPRPIIEMNGHITGVVRYLNNSGYRMIQTASAGGVTRTVLSLTHTWKNTASRGLQVR
jgi:hypothetical protein